MNHTNLIPIYNYAKEFINKIIINEDYNDFESLAEKYYNLSKNYSNLNFLLTKNLLSQPIVVNFYENFETARTELNDLFNNQNINKALEKYKSKIIESVAFKNPEIIKKEKIEAVKNMGLLDWDLFKTLFKNHVEMNNVKEALGWVVGFVESGDYTLSNLIIKDDNGEIDKKESLIKILNLINKKCLSKNPPFNINEDFIEYKPAPAGNLDVLFWSESEQKAYGMCVTRDRKYQIEGNQFIRHSCKLATLGLEIQKLKKDRSYDFLHASDARRLADKILSDKENIKRNLNPVLVNQQSKEIMNHFYKNDFVKDMLILRNEIYKDKKIMFTEKNISVEEMKNIFELTKKSSSFLFFGEAYNSNTYSEEFAGLNLIAYKDNFNHITPFDLKKDSIEVFFENLNAKYNLKTNLTGNELEHKAKELIKEIIIPTNEQKINHIKRMFGEGQAYKEERANLFKAIRELFSHINESFDADGNINEKIKKSIDKFFGKEISDTINIETIKNKDFTKNTYDFLNNIGKGQSEVQYELKELKYCLEIFEKNITIEVQKENINKILDSLSNDNMSKEEVINQLKKIKI